MALKEITKQNVLQAIREYDRDGRENFLKIMASVMHGPTG